MKPKLSLFVAALVMSAVTVACERNPAAINRAPASALHDGGLGLGSGNRADSTNTNGSTTSTGEAVLGGLGLGSGN
jgi:hypothetical protein